MAGVHPKVVQTVMRHSTITLTMDTYGHLFPGQEADAVTRLDDLLPALTDALKADGTDDPAGGRPDKAQRKAQHSGRENLQGRATGCDIGADSRTEKESAKPFENSGFGDSMRRPAKGRESSGAGTRTGFRNPLR